MPPRILQDKNISGNSTRWENILRAHKIKEKHMYQYKDPYIIDFSRVKHYSEMHSVMQEALDFPDYYGRNWDAFWDCLTDMLGRRVHIEILGIEVIEQRFPGQAEILIDIFKEFKHYDNDEYFDDIHIEIHRGNTRESIF